MAACSRGIVGGWPPTALFRHYRFRPISLPSYRDVRDDDDLLGRSFMDFDQLYSMRRDTKPLSTTIRGGLFY